MADRAIQILESWGTNSIHVNRAYNTYKILLDVFGKAGFQPNITVLEKRI